MVYLFAVYFDSIKTISLCRWLLQHLYSFSNKSQEVYVCSINHIS